MLRRPVQPRYHRFAVFTGVLLSHAVLIALLLLHSTTKDRKIEPAKTIAMVSIEADRPAAPKPPPPALPAKKADTFVPITNLSIPEKSESDAPPGASTACATLEVIRKDLLIDAPAVDAIRNAPPATRSIADAVVIWNVGWSPTALSPSDPLFFVRLAIERSLAGVAENCLDEPVAGPRLIPIPDATGQRTILIVFGSGNWSWRALLNSPPTLESETASPVSIPAPIPSAK